MAAVVKQEFQTIETLLREFWQSQDDNNDVYGEETYLSRYVYIYQFYTDIEINVHPSFIIQTQFI
jgi:hypothetical protein